MSNSRQHTILIVDDTLANINLLFEVLQDEYNIKVAISGAEALEKVHLDKPDLILLDVLMPGMDGYETCRRLKANRATREIPVIFVTALSGIRDETMGFEAGAVAFINKPIDILIVRAKVKKHLALCNQDFSPADEVAAQTALTAIDDQQDTAAGLSGNMPGLDLDQGLKNLDGNGTLYRKLLAGFLRDYADTAVKTRTALAKGDYQGVHLIAHTIKGLAGNYGAFSLQKAAARLEQAVAAKDNSRLDELLADFKGLLDIVMASIKQLPAETGEGQEQAEIMDINQLRLQLANLDELLKNNDFLAVSHFAELKPQLQALGQATELAMLEKYIATFAFQQARGELAAVKHKINDV